MTVWLVHLEYETGGDEYSTWHADVVAVFATESLAKEFIAKKTWHDKSHYTVGKGHTVLETLPE